MDDEKTTLVTGEPQFSQPDAQAGFSQAPNAQQATGYNQTGYGQVPNTQPNTGYGQMNNQTGYAQTNAQQNTGYGQMNNQTGYAQPNAQPNTGYGQMSNQTGYAQPNAQPNTGYGQTGYGQMNNQTGYAQPNAQPNTGYGQMNNQAGYAQPNAQPNTGYGQTGYGQMNGQTGYGQMNGMAPQNGYNQTGYAQPNGMQPPRAPRKPLSPGAKKGIIIGGCAAVVLILFFTLILPLLTRAKLEGSYTDGDYVYIFNDGIYTRQSSTSSHPYVGTYTIKDGEVELTEVGDDVVFTSFKFNNKKNTFRDGSTFKSKDKKAKFDIDLDKATILNIEANVQVAAEAALEDKDVSAEATDYGWYFIYEDDLKKPDSDFEEALADKLNYKNNETLQYLMEEANVAMDINISSSGEVTVDVY